jgi:hypothetical protein
MELKILEIQDGVVKSKKRLFSNHIIKTIVYVVLGALASFLIFYFTEGKHMDSIATGDIIRNTFIGGFLGFFLTNSPCARNKC